MGYEYEVYKEGTGEIPKVGEIVTLDLEVLNDKGETIDNSRDSEDRPVFQIPESNDPRTKGNAILGLLRIMKAGDSASVFVPIDSLPQYPDSFEGSAFIQYRMKVYTIELEEDFLARRNEEKTAKMAKAETEARAALTAYQNGEYDDNIKVVEGKGIKVALINDTKGQMPQKDMGVSVDYYGFLKDGSSFDNSARAGRPYSFVLGQGAVIGGWDFGIPEIPEGSSAILDIPYEQAYGAEGRPPSIPAKSDLIFYVTVNKVYTESQIK